MDLQWRDSDQETHPGTWDSLRLTVRGARHPRFVVQVCHPLCIRLSRAGSPILWAKIDDDYWGYTLLRKRSQASVGVLPPIPFDLIGTQSSANPAGNSARRWTRIYADMLAASDATPMLDGEWRLTPYRGEVDFGVISPTELRRVVEQKSCGYIEWDFGDHVYPITLRDRSSTDSGRVKAWRKHARAGSLPPILLYWISGLDAHVVLDGHDRLLAALLEEVQAPALSLELVTERHADESRKAAVLSQVAKALAAAGRERSRPPSERLARATRLIDEQTANFILLDTFVPKLCTAPTLSRILEGGFKQWSGEVRQECAAQGLDPAYVLSSTA